MKNSPKDAMTGADDDVVSPEDLCQAMVSEMWTCAVSGGLSAAFSSGKNGGDLSLSISNQVREKMGDIAKGYFQNDPSKYVSVGPVRSDALSAPKMLSARIAPEKTGGEKDSWAFRRVRNQMLTMLVFVAVLGTSAVLWVNYKLHAGMPEAMASKVKP